MGGTVSRPGGVENPFPVGPALSKDLDLLTTVAVRLLSSSDIYDIANLENPGVCGSYAVFLKKNIEKRLLSFTADLSGGETVEILYQDPSKAIPAGKRREICKRLAGTMVTLVATVVALLASIQVKSDSRAVAARGAIPKPVAQAGGGDVTTEQTGGADISTVLEWLQTHGYIRTVPTIGAAEDVEVELYTKEFAGITNAPKFKLRLKRQISSHRTYDGTLTAIGGKGFPPVNPPRTTPDKDFPTGSLQVQIMNPVSIPGAPTEETLLPFRLSDRSNLPWMAGALYAYHGDGYFFTAAPDTTADPVRAVSPFDLWTDIFRRTQGYDLYTGGRETRANINRAAEVLAQYSRTQDARPLLQAFMPFLTTYTGYRPEVPGYPPAAAGAAGYPPYPGYPPIPGYAPIPSYARPPPPPPVAGAAFRAPVPTLAGATTTSIPAPTTATYDLSKPSADVILRTLRNYRQLIPDESSPAAVRAFTLAGKVNPDRTINTDVCNDPYWRLGGLHLIYPWATLQFLCVNNWEKLGTSGGKDVFHPEWTKFLGDLKNLYSGDKKPKITGPSDNQVLNGYTFTEIEKTALCATTRSPRVRFIRVQDGLLSLQGRYERHVRRVWDLLNTLIVVIVDPETREQTVRLHPSVYSSASAPYVERQAAAARNLLTEFYLGVESDYLKTVGDLTPV